MSVMTDDENEGEDLLDTTYDSNSSALLSPSVKGTVYECRHAGSAVSKNISTHLPVLIY